MLNEKLVLLLAELCPPLLQTYELLTLFKHFQVVELQEVFAVIKVGDINFVVRRLWILHPRSLHLAIGVMSDRFRDACQSVLAFP